MGEFVRVCAIEEVPVGEARQFKVNGKEVAVARVSESGCYAIGGRCTHMRAPLGKGTLEGEVLTCPRHGSQFEVTSGRLVRWVQEPALLRLLAGLIPAFMRRGVPSYRAKVEDGQVLVEVGE